LIERIKKQKRAEKTGRNRMRKKKNRMNNPYFYQNNEEKDLPS
jgi:hypothetical protein